MNVLTILLIFIVYIFQTHCHENKYDKHISNGGAFCTTDKECNNKYSLRNYCDYAENTKVTIDEMGIELYVAKCVCSPYYIGSNCSDKKYKEGLHIVANDIKQEMVFFTIVLILAIISA